MKPMLKPPGTERLKLKYDELLSSFAFKFHLRRYTKDKSKRVITFANNADYISMRHHTYEMPRGRGLHSSTFYLNLSHFGHTSPCPPV